MTVVSYYAKAAANQLLKHLISKFDLGQCSNTLLLLNACGGFIRHHPFAFKECG